MQKLFGKKVKPSDKAKQSNTARPANLKAVVMSDLGNIRTNNEDMGLFLKVADEAVLLEKGYILIVADGMGGHNAGEVASGLATEIISREYFKQRGNAVEKNLEKALTLANKTIFEKASSQKAFQGMGTTCTVLVVIDNDLYFAQVGDSRAYIQKQGAFIQITEDQTYVQQLVNSGDITAAEAAVHPKRNILTNAMGTKPDMRVDTGRCQYKFENKDRLLLCSDGLYDYLNDEEMNRILLENNLQNAATTMIELAKARGGHDNITIVLAEQDNGTNETDLKLTRDAEMLKMTRDADLPAEI